MPGERLLSMQKSTDTGSLLEFHHIRQQLYGFAARLLELVCFAGADIHHLIQNSSCPPTTQLSTPLLLLPLQLFNLQRSRFASLASRGFTGRVCCPLADPLTSISQAALDF